MKALKLRNLLMNLVASCSMLFVQLTSPLMKQVLLLALL